MCTYQLALDLQPCGYIEGRDMSSAAQVLANRQNAQHSTGPSTPEGKAASSRNATRHGLSGVFNVLPHEDPEEFDQVATRIHDEFQPEGENETFLVNQMVQARCKLVRIQRLETLAFEQILTEPGSALDPDARVLAVLCQSGNPLDKLQRYAASAERSYYKALRELESARLRNHKTEAKMLANHINKVVFAPVPGHAERAPVQNEANRTNAINIPRRL